MRRVLLPVVLLLAALVLQLTVLDRLPLPGGVAPDLVLLVLFGVALASRLAARLAGTAKPSGEPAAGLGTPALPADRTPRIRAAAARPRDGWIGGGGWLVASAELARRRPATVRLHLGGTRT